MYRIFLVIFIVSLSGCGLPSFLKIRTAFEEEYIGAKNFKQEIPFEEVKGMLLVEVEIDGKVKRLILDTGSTTCIDTETAKSVETIKLGKRKTVDSNNNKKHINYVKLNEVKVGGIPFHSIVSTVNDLENLKTIACIKVDGILGSNVMNKAIWQINYTTQKITITDSRDSLNLIGNEAELNFYSIGKGVPKIDMTMNDIYIGEAAFDTGYNGTIGVDIKNLPLNVGFIEKEAISTGTLSSSETKIKIAKIPKLKIGQSFVENNVIVNFSKDNTFGLIGTAFIKSYNIVTIDWINQKILLNKNSGPMTNPNLGFGFFPKFHNGEIIVGSIYLNSPAYKKGMRLNDKILKINGLDFSEKTFERYCGFINSSLENGSNKMEVEIESKQSKLKLTLDKVNLLEAL